MSAAQFRDRLSSSLRVRRGRSVSELSLEHEQEHDVEGGGMRAMTPLSKTSTPVRCNIAMLAVGLAVVGCALCGLIAESLQITLFTPDRWSDSEVQLAQEELQDAELEMDSLDTGDGDGESSLTQWESVVDDASVPEQELEGLDSTESAEVVEAEAVVEVRTAALHSSDEDLSVAVERTELLEADLRVKNNILVAARRHLAEAKAEEQAKAAAEAAAAAAKADAAAVARQKSLFKQQEAVKAQQEAQHAATDAALVLAKAKEKRSRNRTKRRASQRPARDNVEGSNRRGYSKRRLDQGDVGRRGRKGRDERNNKRRGGRRGARRGDEF